MVSNYADKAARMRFTMLCLNVYLWQNPILSPGSLCQFAKAVYLHWPPVFPAGRDMGDNTGVCLFADIDPIHLDNALSRVKPSCCSTVPLNANENSVKNQFE